MRGFEIDNTRLAGLGHAAHPGSHVDHVLSRRTFMVGAAGATAAALGSGFLRPTDALAAGFSTSPPKPTTNVLAIGGLDFHLVPLTFESGVDLSSITDFNGFVGVADVRGTGTGTNPDGSVESLLFDTDMRFMSGVYVGLDGAVHKGVFGFV
jgi:hypothetical protein